MWSAVLSLARRARRAITASALLPALATAACGGGSDEPEQVAATCSSVVAAICAAACECGGSAGCAIAGDSGDPEDWIAFDNKNDCLTVYSLGCGGGGQDQVDYAACAGALKAPQCQPTSGGEAFAFPAACEPPPPQ